VLVAVSMILLLSMVALAVDIGLIYVAVGEMQNTADASALAGASGLVEHAVRTRVHEYGALNPVLRRPVLPSELDVTIGNWDGILRTFTPTPDEGVNGVLPNAVRVEGTRENIALYFAPVIGHYFSQAQRAATALGGGGRCAGIWGLDGVLVNGDVVTDSYDSNAGPYGPGNIRPNGDLCSCRDIKTHGGVSIEGDAMYGEGYAFLPTGSSYEVLGYVGPHYCTSPNINVDYAGAALANNNSLIPQTYLGHKALNGQSKLLRLTSDDHLTLPPGTFYFSSVTLLGQSYIEITGPTTIYIDGNAVLTGGGVVNVTGDPRNLTLYVRGPDIKLGGTATFYGSLVAPTATVTTLGTFNAYGTLLSQYLECLGDAQFHVDEGLVYDLFGYRAATPMLVH
jgi:hypothetical protein